MPDFDSCSSTMQRGDDAGVGPEVLPEVVVRGVLAAEHRVGVGHDLLHERVADAALHRLAAELADHLGDGLRADHVVHDRFAGVAGEHRGGEDRGGGGPGDDLALVVDEDDAVGVAVEREPDRGVLGEHRPPEVGEVRERHDVGGMVREGAVELAVEHRELERQTLEHRGHDHAAHAVGGVGDDAHRHAARRRRRRTGRARRTSAAGRRARPGPGLSARSSSPPATMALIWASPVSSPIGAAPARQSLMPLYCGRVVAGGDHRRRARRDRPRRSSRDPWSEPEVERRRRRRSWRLRRTRRRAVPTTGGQSWPTRMRRAPVNADERVAYPARDRLVELVGIDAADVVGLEDGVERSVGHGSLEVLTAVGAGRKSYPAAPPGHVPRSPGVGRIPHQTRRARRSHQSGERPRPPQPTPPTIVPYVRLTSGWWGRRP